ncbi:MAG: glutathione S-transferase family protein, partial [Elainellaceae cyanobacterium]
MSTVTLYELAGESNDYRFSPYCWRARLALAHKDLTVDTVPWRFTEKDAIAFSGQGKVPVLVDDDRTVTDSWAIAEYLDERYPADPLLGNAETEALCYFLKCWDETALIRDLGPVIILNVYNHLHPKDKAYFRETREAQIGRSLEDFSADVESKLDLFRKALSPVRRTLRHQPFIAGTAPNFADHIVMGRLQMAQVASPLPPLASDDPIFDWRQRMVERYPI